MKIRYLFSRQSTEKEIMYSLFRKSIACLTIFSIFWGNLAFCMNEGPPLVSSSDEPPKRSARALPVHSIPAVEPSIAAVSTLPSSASHIEPPMRLSHTAPSRIPNHRENVTEAQLTHLAVHSDLFRNWALVAATKVIETSEFIYARWALSQISPREMAVSELIIPSQKVLTLAGIGLLESAEDFVAEERRKYEVALSGNAIAEAEMHAHAIGMIFRSANIIGIIACVPVMTGMRLIRPIMISYGYNPDLYDPVDEYYRIFSLCVPLRHLYFLSENFSIAEGHVKNALLISSISFLTSGLNYLFIRGPLKFDNVFEGMAVASIIEAALSVGGYLAIYRLHNDFKKYEIFNTSINSDILVKILKKGTPLLIKRVLGAITPLIFTQFIVPDKPEILSALALTTQIFLPSNIILYSVGKTLNIAIKRSMDKTITAKAFKYGTAGITQSQIIAATLVLGAYLYPELVASLFVDINKIENQEMIKNYKYIINLQLLNHFVYALGNSTAWALRGIGQLTQSTYSEIITSFGIGLPVSYVLIKHCAYGIEGAVIGPLVGNIFNTLYLQYKWQKSKKNIIDLPAEPPPPQSYFTRVKNFLFSWCCTCFKRKKD